VQDGSQGAADLVLIVDGKDVHGAFGDRHVRAPGKRWGS
jgi:hypothetical protein